MSAAAQPTSLPRTPSRRQPPPPQSAYPNPTPDYESSSGRVQRAQSTTTSSAAPSSPRRAASTSQSHSRTPSNQLPNVAQRDYEQPDLATPRPGSSRRSESQDRPSMARGESARAHTRTQSRYNEPTPAPQAAVANGSSNAGDSRTTTTTATGTTNLRRRTTIDAATGSWDLGKTIGAGSMGKVKLARNRVTSETVAVKIVPRGSTDADHHQSQAERDRAERSKEIRTAREAAIVTLVDHPYICGMRDVVRTNYHWYMLFEYVNGGQMLDYIISHGRLKEKQARKFGRQIASALDYCHRNSIVHRDLKIENILISKNGDIKIIDFGLSNLFSPRNVLKTFCGSLYFAAPELLQAKAYTGPEVDVWSFGIVLYVLVCGKVPFDDQSMPQLHAKIKRGNVEYPPWLSLECKSLIARMLSTNPQERATMHEIMNHPWMMKGYNVPPDNYLPLRKPITLPLDPEVVDKMTGFDFGDKEVITAQLTKIIQSADYQRAVTLQEHAKMQATPDLERKRGVFDFYKRRNSTTSRDTLNTPSSEAVQLGNDPVNAFHPLISVYYLASEKIERERKEANPGALAMPQSPGEKPIQMTVPPMPEAPAAAVTNSQTYEMPGEKPTGGRTRARARTHGEDEVQEGLQGLKIDTAPSPVNPTVVEPAFDAQQQLQSAPVRKESTAAGLLRRLSTRRSKDPPERLRREDRPSHPPPSLAVFAPGGGQQQSETPRKSFSVRRTRDRDQTPTGARDSSVKPETGALLSPPSSGGDGASDRSSKKHGLGRSISVNSSDMRRRLTRRGVSEGNSMRPPMTSSSSQDRKPSMDQSSASQRNAESDVEGSRPKPGSMAGRTKSVGHNRRPSAMRNTLSRRNDPGRTSDVPEETDAEMQDDEGPQNGSSSPTGFKPVYLKGFFSVSTTSSKPLPFIRNDIVRVLNQLGVEWQEVKGGFRCRHAPSIKAGADELPVGAGALNSNPPVDSNSGSGVGHRRKISFGGFNRNAERDAFRRDQNQAPATPRSKFSAQAARDNASYENTEDEDAASGEEVAGEDRTPTAANAARVAGETTTHVQTDLGSNMTLRFEIFVVKVPLIALHGIQFKKIDGGTWQYKNMAQTILNELRL